VAVLREPDVRRRILAEKSVQNDPRIAVVVSMIENGLAKIFRSATRRTTSRRPRRASPPRRRAPAAIRSKVLYDHMLELDGRQPPECSRSSRTATATSSAREMLEHPNSAFGLGGRRRALRRDLRREQ